MRSLANTRIQIKSPATQDEYDDVVPGSDKGSVIPASLIERREQVADPADNKRLTIIRYAVLRIKPGIDIEQDDIVVDLKTGRRWAVDEVTQLSNPMTGMDLRCQLRRASA